MTQPPALPGLPLCHKTFQKELWLLLVPFPASHVSCLKEKSSGCLRLKKAPYGQGSKSPQQRVGADRCGQPLTPDPWLAEASPAGPISLC